MFWIGAYDIDPRHLFFVIGVQTDAERDRLRTDQQFNERLKQGLVTVDWTTPPDRTSNLKSSQTRLSKESARATGMLTTNSFGGSPDPPVPLGSQIETLAGERKPK